MAKAFASSGDTAEKTISFTEIGRDLWAFTAEGDPNSGVIIGNDAVMIVDAQATPRLAGKVIEKIRTVTDKPIKYVVLSHYHAVRVLGASAYGASEIIMSEKARSMVTERGQEDWDSGIRPFSKAFRGTRVDPRPHLADAHLHRPHDALSRQAPRRSAVPGQGPHGRRHHRPCPG